MVGTSEYTDVWTRILNSFYLARGHENGKTLRGVGMTMEGIENNPVMYELLMELPWRPERFSKDDGWKVM